MNDIESSRSETTSSKISSLSHSDTSLHKPPPHCYSTTLIYRHLVTSSCVGIFQVWWHPYVHDLTKLVPFLCVYGIFAVIIAFPIMYLELALGAVTRKSALDCWDIAPMARGVGVSMLTMCALPAVTLGAVASWLGAVTLHCQHGDGVLPWLHCAPAVNNCAHRHAPIKGELDTPAQSFFFTYVLHLQRDDSSEGLGSLSEDLALYHVITWTLVFLIVGAGVFSYSQLLVIKDVLLCVLVSALAVGAFRLHGAESAFRNADWSALANVQIWTEALEYALLQTSTCQGSLILLGSYCPKQRHSLTMTAALSVCASVCCTVVTALTLGAVHGALQHDYMNATVNVWKGPSASLVLWAERMSRVPAARLWSSALFLTFYLTAVLSIALLIQTIMSTLTSEALCKMACPLSILLLALFCLTGVVTLCTQKGLYIIKFLLDWPIVKPRIIIAAVTALMAVAHGKSHLYGNLMLVTGEYPCFLCRVAWCVIPCLLLGALVSSVSLARGPEDGAGWAVTGVLVAPVFLVLILYLIFKFRLRKIIRSETDEKM